MTADNELTFSQSNITNSNLYVMQNYHGKSIKSTIREESVPLKLCFGMMASEECFTGRREELEDLHGKLEKNKSAVIYGLAGIGKTELARKYAWNKKDNYDYIIWFTVETDDNLKNSFKQLAVHLDMPDVCKKDDEEIKTYVHKIILKRKCLIVLDNLESPKILNFLPPSDNIFIIVTSQTDRWSSNKKWADCKIHLGALASGDCLRLFKELLAYSIYEENEEQLTDLTSMLGNLPLGIKLAASYINHGNSDNRKLSVSEYIDYLKEDMLEDVLLNEEDFDGRYDKTIEKAFSLIMNKINNEISRQFLFVSCYLPPDNIPEAIYKILGGTKYNIGLKIVTEFSLITVNKSNEYNMHRLVQGYLFNILKKDPDLRDRTERIVVDCIISFLISLSKQSEEVIFLNKNIQSSLFLTVKPAIEKINDISLFTRDFKKSQPLEKKQMILLCLICTEHFTEVCNINNNMIYDDINLYLVALTEAVETGNIKFSNYLLDKITTIDEVFNNIFSNIISVWDSTGREKVVEKKHLDILKLLTSKGFPINVYANNILNRAVLSKQKDIVNIMINENIYGGYKDCGATLHAARTGDVDMLKFLVSKGFSTDVTTNCGRNILHQAVVNNQTSVVNYIIDNDVCPDSKNNIGWSAIHWAAEYGHTDMLKYLMSKGFSTNITTNDDLNILHVAVANNQANVVNYIIDNNICSDSKDNQGWCAVHFAAGCGHVDILQILINKGFSTDNKTNNGLSILHVAVANNQASVVNYIIDNNMCIDSKDNQGWCAIHFASEKGYIDILKILISRGFSTDITTNDGLTILHLAVDNNQANIVNYIIDNNMCSDSKDNHGWCAVHFAAGCGHVDILQILINKGFCTDNKTNDGLSILHVAVANNQASVVNHIINNNICSDSKDNHGWCATHFASEKGYIDMLKILISRRFSTDITTNDGLTVLHLAVANNQVSVVKYIIDNDVCGDSKNNEGLFAIHCAAECGHIDILKFLIDKGFSAEITTDDGGTILHLAVTNNHEDIIMYIFDKNFNLNYKDKTGWLSVHYAVREGHLNILKLLLSRGSSLNDKTNDNQTLLHIAARFGHEHIVDHLLELGMDMHEIGPDGHVFIHVASLGGNYNVFKRLFYKGCANLKNDHNNTVFQYGIIGGNLKIISELIDDGANVKNVDDDGDTPLHSVVAECEQNIVEIVNVLLSQGADPNIKNKKGQTPLHIAREKGFKDIIEILDNAIENIHENKSQNN